MGRKVSIGAQGFEDIRKKDYFYVDKTNFIKEWWESGDDITLITRPRRFGKTLNMDMLECFFSNHYAGRNDLFEGLYIWKEKKYREMQGTFPVISMSFAKAKGQDYDTAKEQISTEIFRIYAQNSFLLDGDILSDNEKSLFNAVVPEMNIAKASSSINNLCMWLSRYYGKKVIVLLDEYDAPMQEAWVG